MLRVVVVFLLAAAVVYGIFWLLERRRSGPANPMITRGPAGPDDDDDFLRELDRRNREGDR